MTGLRTTAWVAALMAPARAAQAVVVEAQSRRSSPWLAAAALEADGSQAQEAATAALAVLVVLAVVAAAMTVALAAHLLLAAVVAPAAGPSTCLRPQAMMRRTCTLTWLHRAPAPVR